MISWTACPHWWMGTKWLLNLFQLLFFLQAPELWPIVSLRQHATVLSTHWPQGKHSLMCYPTKSPFHSASPHRFFPALSLASVLSCFNHVLLFETLRTVACQGLLSLGALQARIPKWIATPSSKGSSQPRDQIHVSYNSGLAGKFFTTSNIWEAPIWLYVFIKTWNVMYFNQLWLRSLSLFTPTSSIKHFLLWWMVPEGP